MDKIKDFFWLCAGSNKHILEKCPSESSKYVGIGATIFFTGIFAAISGGYALYTIFDNIWTSVFFGLIWGLMIFNLDRFIVSSMRKNGDQTQEFLTAFPRLILAILISIVIAKPLELKMFDKEIEGELAIMQQEQLALQEGAVRMRFTEENSTLNNEIQVLKAEIRNKTVIRDELIEIARQEADGTGGSGKRNPGPIYRIKKANADRVEDELRKLTNNNNRLIDEKQALISQNNAKSNNAILLLKEQNLNGLASRLDALERLTKNSEAIWIANFFIILLFLAVETAPVFVKLISQRGPYDYVLRAEEYGFEAGHYEDIAKINAGVRKRTTKLSQEEIEFVLEKLRMNLGRT